MKPEDHLDQLIELRDHGANRPLFLDAETQELLDAAEKLSQLRSINVPSLFAQKLEGELRARARAQNSAKLKQSGQLLLLAPARGSTRTIHPLKRQAWAAVICLVSILLIICTVILVSISSLPGDPFYTLTQTGKHVKLHLSNRVQDQANAAIQQLYSSLSDLKTVVNDGRGDDAIQQALNALADWTSTSQQEVATLDTSSEIPAIEQKLAQGIADEKQTLHFLLNQVDWSMKLAFSHQLGVLGEQVPTVATASIHILNSGNALVTLTGTNFSPQAQFIVDGKPMGSVSQRSAYSLVALISNAERLAGTHTVGILNPDKTAAQTTVTFPTHLNGTSTPTLTPTRRPDE